MDDGGFVGAGVVFAGASVGVVAPAAVLVIKRTSTRRFLARPSAVLFDSTGLYLPNPIK